MPLAHLSVLALATGAQAQTQSCGTTIFGPQASALICAPATGAASIATGDGTFVTTTGTTGLRATARNSDAAVALNGTSVSSTNPGAAASAMQVQVLTTAGNTTPGNASASIGGGTNGIRVQGSGLDGVAVTNATAGSSSITVAPGTGLSIVNGATGNEHDGLDINATGGGHATVAHAGTGTISVVGGNAISVKAAGAGQISVQVGAGNALTVDNTDPGSGSSNHAGIQTRTTGTGLTSINNAASIASTGTRSYGIFTTATTGDSVVRNSGAITTTGLEGSGIRGTSTGNVDIGNSGPIATSGGVAHGIYVNPGLASTGNITVSNAGAISVGNGSVSHPVGSRGIYLIGRNAGNVTVTGSGSIDVQGSPTTTRGSGIIVSAHAGNVSVNYGGAISARGDGAGGIRADSTGGNVDIIYTGSGIETFHSNANAIYGTTNSAVGMVSIAAQGRIITHANLDGSADGTGTGSFGLQGLSQGGDVNVTFTGSLIDVNGSGAGLLAANAYGSGTGAGTLTVNNAGGIVARGDRQQGVHTRSSTGAQFIDNQGAIQTMGGTASQGILAEASGAAAVTVVNRGAISTRGTNSTGIDVYTQGGSVEVRNSQPVNAGWGTSAGVAMSGISQTLSNSSSIQALSDVAVRADNGGVSGALAVALVPIDIDAPDTTPPAPDPGVEPAAAQKPGGSTTLAAPGDVGVFISNTGQLDGTVSAGTSAVSFSNAGIWNLRSFADTNGDGMRETWNIAQSNLGISGNNRVDNTGTLNLVAQAAAGIATFNAAGAYLPLGQGVNSPRLGGPVQGQVLGVNTFTNSGLIDLAVGGSVVGNVLVIGGGQTAGLDGGGVYISNGGRMKLNAVLNAGGAESRSDMLVVDSTRTGAGGPTRIQVHNVGGAGAFTQGNGIAVVELLNKAAAASDANAFALDGRAVAGPYEYRLLRGNADGSSTDAWYLRSEQALPPPAPVPNVVPPVVKLPLYRPEVGAYLSNQRQAGGMFVHSLHDRLGEPQWIEGQNFETQDDKRRSGWLRVVNKQTKADSADGNFNVDTAATLIQGGGDLARWGVGGDTGRLHLGAMLGYGSSSGDAHAQGNPAQAQAKVEGWSVGAYGTWYQNDASKLGWYVDGWGTYGWFDNKVQGDALPDVKYDAKALTLSAETGYAMKLDNSEWVIEPQGQLIWVKYDEDDIAEPNGTRISGKDGSGWISRLGVRAHRTWVREDGRKLQPYVTLNWWHDSVDNELNFNTVALKNIYPNNRYEVKLGLNADLSRGWTAWGNLGYQWGEQSYRSTLVRLGAKYTW